jgi:hypothetical protein
MVVIAASRVSHAQPAPAADAAGPATPALAPPGEVPTAPATETVPTYRGQIQVADVAGVALAAVGLSSVVGGSGSDSGGRWRAAWAS